MCFSASASFVAGTALGAAGGATWRKAKTAAERPFAAVPLLFGIHQLIEGVVWVTFGMPRVQALAVHGYLFFALAFWPAFVPYAVWRLEPDARRRAMLAWFAWFGAAIGLYLFSWLIQGQAAVIDTGRGLVYDLPLPDVPGGLGAYVIATCGSCLASSRKFIRVFGLALFGSFLIANWAYQQALYSVWCFFAAILSLIVYVHLRQKD
jgi:hypothetical protein